MMIEQLIEEFDSVIIDTSAIGWNIKITDRTYTIIDALLQQPLHIIHTDADYLRNLNLKFMHAYKVPCIDDELSSLVRNSYGALAHIKYKQSLRKGKSRKTSTNKRKKFLNDSGFEDYRSIELAEREDAIKSFCNSAVNAQKLIGSCYNGVKADGELFKRELAELSSKFIDGRSEGKGDEQVVAIAAELATQGIKTVIYGADRRMLRLVSGIIYNIYKISQNRLPVSIFYANSQHNQINEITLGIDVREILAEYNEKSAKLKLA